VALVVDCTVIANALLHQPFTRHAHRVLESKDSLHAPSLLASELANALWLQARSGHLTAVEAVKRLDAIESSGIELVDDAGVRRAALTLALEYEHPTYDCEYIALALALGAGLVTADRRQFELAREVLGKRAVWLGEYQG